MGKILSALVFLKYLSVAHGELHAWCNAHGDLDQ